jgi:outer membrane murein-binding lipoprotein Lpp
VTVRAVAAAVAVLALAGCGGSSASLDRFRTRAARVCARTLAQDVRIAPPERQAATGAFLRRGIGALRPELAKLRALRPPNAQASAYSEALSSLAREIAILTTTVHDLDRGADPLPAIKTLQHRLAPVEADANAAWRTLDVPACVNR